MHRNTLSLSAACVAAATMSVPASAADVAITAQGPVIELGINESVEARPDVAEIGAGVTTEAQTAVAAMQANARAMTAVIERIEALGIAERDIQTTGISLNPQYDYDQDTRRQIFRGYQVSNRVQVTLREIDRVGETLDALVAAGATDLSGPSFSIDDASAARAQARERAMTTARARALEYARLAGYADVRLLQLSESVSADRPMPMARAIAMDVAEASTPVQPGRVEAGVNLNVTYEMTR